ncbi:MAG TPA: fumarate hydratase [Sedimentisphaerales bacterium]|nr:fumarate hydratase [Sedimentisphaerales bacterium]HRS12269.1 fumarate hydratase [Sedimentisphaerales bacterium]HRV48858.1 fumarate hydratase [Sedimentisphaerales bacterium]
MGVVRTIEFEQIVRTVESLCIAACHELPDDVRVALERAASAESNPAAAKILTQLLENAAIAARERIPLCQDTGLAVVFVEQGAEVVLRGADGSRSRSIVDAINEGVRAGYENGYLRKSVVADPLKARTNTGTNTPAIVHHRFVPGDRLTIAVMAKGGGCENKSRFRMFRPTSEKSEITDWIVEVVGAAGADACPPFVVGVGIGGDFELSCLLSKKALLRNLGEPHADTFYAEMERELLQRVNALGVGPQGLGGDTTALGVLIETAPCHIASLPVAVNIECHSHRHKTAIL